MAVDISKIGPGDTVAVQCVVTDVSPKAVYSVAVRAAGCVQAQPTWVSPSDIVSHTPRELQVGDRVRIGISDPAGEVVGVYEGKAWVKLGRCGPLTYDIANLERIP